MATSLSKGESMLPAAATTVPAGVSAADNLNPINILLVDDQPARLLIYRTILSDLHENLVDATSGAEALMLLMTRDFALVLLDVNMPGMDGFETASLIHEHPRFEKTPIIFVTAINLSDLDRMRGYRLGAFDYVMVPIIPEILRSKVVALAELYRKRRDLELLHRDLAVAHEELKSEKARELAVLNASLHSANEELARRNTELQTEVTERKRVEERLIEQDRRKDEFLAMLAHELRNPLASIANALAAFKLSAAAPHPLHDAMSRQLALLMRLIDDLLDVARIRRGKLALKVGQSTLNATLDAAIETISPLLKRGEHPLNVRRLPTDVLMHVDHERLSQVFSNLLNNATKYSDALSPIDIEVTRNADWIEVTVVDRGIGLTAEQCEQIFGLFAQVDTALERSRGGLGIGLTLARHIVDMHGGELMATSDGLGRGSRFIVRLPFQPVPSLVTSNISGLGQSPACRVLIVDDNVDSADSLAVLLQLLGHDTRCIYDARAAAREAEIFSPDVIFLDIGMPGMSGYDVARQLRAQPDAEAFTLVALTGWGQPEDRKRTNEAGFDHHLVKPTDPQSIERILRELKPRTAPRT